MSDRIFASALLAITLIYGFFAFFMISAPIQYDPLGPQAWPRLLTTVMLLCCIGLLWRPAVEDFDMNRATWTRLALVLALLVAYAVLFEPLGFVISTALFATAGARLLGATWARAAIFAVLIGVGGYVLCAGLLDLNLPAGPLPRL